MKKKPSILFLSTHNAARGQIAEAMLRHLAGDRFLVQSAGLFPEPVHPLTYRVLEEEGIETGLLASKDVRDYLARRLVNVAIILGDEGPSAPRMYPFAPATLTWRFENPLTVPATEEESLLRFRRLRDTLRARIETWLEEVTQTLEVEETALA